MGKDYSFGMLRGEFKSKKQRENARRRSALKAFQRRKPGSKLWRKYGESFGRKRRALPEV